MKASRSGRVRFLPLFTTSCAPPASPSTRRRAYMEPRFSTDFSRVAVQLSAFPARPLTIGRTDDPLETAADSAAERAVSQPDSMMARAGVDFGRVQIHTGTQAAEAARAVSSRAFTVGQHIVFDEGEYQPHTRGGRRLLAHELAHVVQQAGPQSAPPTTIRRQAVPGAPYQPIPAVADPTAAPVAGDQQPPSKDDAKLAKTKDGDKAGAESEPEATAQVSGKPGPARAGTRDQTKADAQAKVAKIGSQAAGAKADAPPEKDKDADAAAKAAEPQSVADLGTGNLALIDEELAEHQRWGGAAAVVGAAESGQRAKFLAQAAEGGAEGSFSKGLVAGLETGARSRSARRLPKK